MLKQLFIDTLYFLCYAFSGFVILIKIKRRVADEERTC